MNRPRVVFGLWLAIAATALAQGPGGGLGGPPPDSQHGAGFRGGGPPRGGRGRGPGASSTGPGGRWWMDAGVVARLGLTADQQRRIDAIFQQSRLKLIDLSAAVEKEEAVLEPLMEVDQPDEKKVLAQIDRIAQARAELEKANGAMLFGFRGVLNSDQWKKLQAEDSHPAPPPGPGREHGGPPPDRPR